VPAESRQSPADQVSRSRAAATILRALGMASSSSDLE
jgi:hypothetical protein